MSFLSKYGTNVAGLNRSLSLNMEEAQEVANAFWRAKKAVGELKSLAYDTEPSEEAKARLLGKEHRPLSLNTFTEAELTSMVEKINPAFEQEFIIIDSMTKIERTKK